MICFQSYVQIRETVRGCACFRGVYLDYLEKTNEVNKRNMEELAVIQYVNVIYEIRNPTFI